MNATAHRATDIKPSTKTPSPAEIARSCNQFEHLLTRVDSREQLLQQAGALLRKSNASFFTRIELPSGGVEPVVETVTSEFDRTPMHLEKWAVSIAIKAASSDKPIVESATDQMGFQVHMAGVLVSRGEAGTEILSALFSQGSESGLLEVILLNSVSHTLREWDAREENREFVFLAEDTAALVDLRSRIETAETVSQCCSQIANELQQFLTVVDINNQAELNVYTASVDPDGLAKLVAVSGSDALPNDAKLVEALESAFGECLCRNQITFWPAETAERHALLCHQRLSQALQMPHLQTVPLHDSRGIIVGILTLASSGPIKDRVRRLLSAAAQPLGSTIELVKRAQQNHLQKLLNRLRESVRSHKTRIALKCAAAVLLLGMIPMPYRVASQCELQPLQRRYVCAPFQAQLGQCNVEPGDIVAKDQVLARLDEREIRMELAQVAADFHRASKERDGLLAAHESGEARLAGLEADALRARNELLSHRAENLNLKSPIDGMVIEGDHRDNVGMPLQTGQSLFQIAPLAELNVELYVRDGDVRYVKSGMPATIWLEAFPFEKWQGTIERIQPAAELRNDESVFVATVQIENPDGKLRPGMTGSARISSVWRPIAWNWLHQPVARCLRWFGW